MIERALPEGVLGPGGWIEAWVYFDKGGPALGAVLRMDVLDAGSGRLVGESRAPVGPD